MPLKIAAWRCPLAERDSHQITCPGHGFPDRLHSTDLAQDPGQGEEEAPWVGRHADSGSALGVTRTECLQEACLATQPVLLLRKAQGEKVTRPACLGQALGRGWGADDSGGALGDTGPMS